MSPLAMLEIPGDIDFAEARRLIDEEWHNCEKRILQLKMQRNTFTSIAKIPDEVLLEIFTILRKTLKAELWLHVTHVCRHWRWVAIEAPGLWTTYPPTHNHNLTLLYLERSAHLGLDVLFDDRTSQDTAIAVLSNIRRIQILLLGGVHYSFLTRMQEFLLDFGQEAPVLSCLFITALPSHHNVFKLLESTFGRSLLLQTFRIRHINFDWAMLPLPNLTSLSLEYLQMSSPLPWERFYRTLAAMPLLKDVRLDFRTLQLRGLPSGTTPVRLPHLVTLHLAQASEAEVVGFLSTAMMPSLQNASIICNAEDLDSHAPIIAAISSLIERGDFGIVDSLAFYENEISVLNSSENLKCIKYGHPGRLTENKVTQFLIALLSGVSALTAGGDSILTRATLGLFPAPCTRIFEIFAALPSLESIVIREEMFIPFLHVFNIPISATADTQLPFPNLKSIVFEVDEYLHLENDPLLSEELVDFLLDCMMQRCNYSIPIAALSIPWTTTKQQFESLEEVVVDVKFKRKENFWVLSRD